MSKKDRTSEDFFSQTDTSGEQSKPARSAEERQDKGGTLSLLNGASPQAPIIGPELEKQRQIAANENLPLNERLEDYEDIVDSDGRGSGDRSSEFIWGNCCMLAGPIMRLWNPSGPWV